MNILDKLRREIAISRYNFWLELYNVGLRRRRSLRKDLRSNLTEASTDLGTKQAIANLGSIRHLAKDVAEGEAPRIPWMAGISWGFTALGASIIALFILAANYTNGVTDSGVSEPVTGSIFPFWGSEIMIESNTNLSTEVSSGFVPFTLAIIVFILVTRPWRLLFRGA